MDNARIERVLAELKKDGLTQMIVSDPSSIRYLTGVSVEPMERLFALYLTDTGRHKLFLNRLFNVPETGMEEIWTTDTDDVTGILAANIDRTRDIGIDKTWPARFLLPLMAWVPDMRFRLASGCVDRVRARKDADEQARMRRSSEINDRCILETADFIREGMTEREVSDFIAARFAAHGAAGPSFPSIVSFGANAADPHHMPDDTRLKTGDCIVVDMGCIYEGYASDMTRTFFCREAPQEYAAVFEVVRRANEAAEKLVRPGARFCDLDDCARSLITDAGYGPNFTHRLGHFIGAECHEAGDVSAANTAVLEPGNVFSIEPGIYLPGKFGARVEDLVLVTQDGCEILNHADKTLRIVG